MSINRIGPIHSTRNTMNYLEKKRIDELFRAQKGIPKEIPKNNQGKPQKP